jgi:hypothetical protein
MRLLRTHFDFLPNWVFISINVIDGEKTRFGGLLIPIGIWCKLASRSLNRAKVN